MSDTISGTSSSNYTLIQPIDLIANIIPLSLTVTESTVSNKTYDGTTVATITNGILVGVIGSDNVILTQTGTFSNANVGNGKIVTMSDTISGTSSLNYTLIQPIGLTANITYVSLTVTGSTVANKTYDGTTVATITNGLLVGVIGSDNVVLTQIGTFSNANVGNGKTVTVNDTISGTSSSNYTLTQPSNLSANITSKTLIVKATNQTTTYGTSLNLGTVLFSTIGLVNNNSVTSVTLIQNNNSTVPNTQIAGTYSGSINGIIASDALGTGLTNYIITYEEGTLTINPASLTIIASNQNTTYGTSLNLGNTLFSTTGLVNSDTVTNVTLIQYGNTTIPVGQSAGTYSGSINGIIANNALGTGLTNYTIRYQTGTLIINQISLTAAGITFNWLSYIPSISYNVLLSNYQLNCISPKNPYTNTPIGTITYIGKNIDTNIYDITNFTINGIPNVGTYTLTAILTSTDNNYLSTTLSTINTKYNITILPSYPSIQQHNPLQILKGSSLTIAQLNAISNTSIDPTKITYCDKNGNILNIGDIITEDIEIISKINDYTNSNYYNKYTFTKVNLFTK